MDYLLCTEWLSGLVIVGHTGFKWIGHSWTEAKCTSYNKLSLLAD